MMTQTTKAAHASVSNQEHKRYRRRGNCRHRHHANKLCKHVDMTTTCSCFSTRAATQKQATSLNLRRGWPRFASRAGRFPWVRRPSAWNRGYPWVDPFWHHPQRTGEQQSDGPPLMMAGIDWTGVDGGGPILGGDFGPHRGKGGAWS